MRHHVSGKKLNRSANHRQALFKNLVRAFFTHGALTTTSAKAKSIQGLIDTLMTEAKTGTITARRQIDKFLSRTKLVNKLVDEIAPKTTRQSGFTRIIRLSSRMGDNAPQVRLEWVDEALKEQLKKVKAVKAKPKKEAIKTKAKVKAKTLVAPKAMEIKSGVAGGEIKPHAIRQKSGER